MKKLAADLFWGGSEWTASCGQVLVTAPTAPLALWRLRRKLKLPRKATLTPRLRMPWHAGRRIRGLLSVEREARARRVSVEAELLVYGLGAKDVAFLTR